MSAVNISRLIVYETEQRKHFMVNYDYVSCLINQTI